MATRRSAQFIGSDEPILGRCGEVVNAYGFGDRVRYCRRWPLIGTKKCDDHGGLEERALLPPPNFDLTPHAEIVIYALYDSGLPDIPRYVGKVIQSRYRKRLGEHLSDALRRQESRKAEWIRSVQLAGRQVLQRIIDFAVTESEADLKEEGFIRSWMTVHNLTNVRNGGEGQIGFRHSPETRRRMSVSHQGLKYTMETRAKVSAAGKGRPVSLETRSKISAARIGRPLSIEHRAAIKHHRNAEFRAAFVLVMECLGRESPATSERLQSMASCSHHVLMRVLNEAIKDGNVVVTGATSDRLVWRVDHSVATL